MSESTIHAEIDCVHQDMIRELFIAELDRREALVRKTGTDIPMLTIKLLKEAK